MKIRNKVSGEEADVPEVLAGVLVSAGGWEAAAENAVAAEAPAKAPAKKAPAKAPAKKAPTKKVGA
jgi:hypothetical protein